jgi:N-formylglutamate amidohydrolase
VPPRLLVHVPHASTSIPADLRDQVSLDDATLARELLRMTDRWTDRIAATTREDVAVLAYPVSRLVVDPERFESDEAEPMASRGMGAVYTRTSDGTPLRAALSADQRERLLERFYRPHHRALTDAIEAMLSAHGVATILDLHSFATHPLPHEPDQSPDRPDVCLGTDAFHTPGHLVTQSRAFFAAAGCRVAIDAPFAGAIVPMRHYRSDPRVRSIMLELRRGLYMDEATGEPTDRFAATRDTVQRFIAALAECGA